MRIGIFGGSFNPPHMMHKNIALELLKMDYLDKVIYVPTGGLYNKVGLDILSRSTFCTVIPYWGRRM